MAVTQASGVAGSQLLSVRLYVFSQADSFGDYVVLVDDNCLTRGATLTRLISWSSDG